MSFTTGQWCRKCSDKTKAKVVLRKKDAYCKQCFLTSVSHKFRACLGKSKTMRPGDKVLVCFSGTDNSISLLHLIRTGLQETSHKRLMFEPCVVYIDEATALQLTTEDSGRITASVDELLQMFNFPVYKVPLELSIESEEVVENYLNGGIHSHNTSNLCDLFNSISDTTSKMDLLSKLRYNLLIQVAKVLGCNKMFTAETADDLAVKLMTNVSLGRGAQLPYDVGFSDERCPEVKVVRPLRDLSKKELVFYNVFHNLKSAHVPSLSTKADVHSSIQKLTESFLCELQDGFPSTLSTVFRVADKLTTTPGERDVCPLCKTPLDTDDVASSSLSATQFSRLVSSSGPSDFDVASSKDVNSDGPSRHATYRRVALPRILLQWEWQLLLIGQTLSSGRGPAPFTKSLTGAPVKASSQLLVRSVRYTHMMLSQSKKHNSSPARLSYTLPSDKKVQSPRDNSGLRETRGMSVGGVWKLQRRRDAWTRQQCAHSVAKLCLRATDSRPSSASPVPYVAAAQIHPPALFGGRDCS
ncbi:Cytoplasmic tRNA 2-thiolation protein 2 [Homalodisca vitripennis]|nr:Cytoplasmic tRNA 2-thiolation protein 2 [Homalodisca vitripennis]KAG8303772.1 Cytoplasmic tRNA 2-thiolation protein 2 [Homalodisca vitripennis]